MGPALSARSPSVFGSDSTVWSITPSHFRRRPGAGWTVWGAALGERGPTAKSSACASHEQSGDYFSSSPTPSLPFFLSQSLRGLNDTQGKVSVGPRALTTPVNTGPTGSRRRVGFAVSCLGRGWAIQKSNPGLLQLQADSLTTELSGKPTVDRGYRFYCNIYIMYVSRFNIT